MDHSETLRSGVYVDSILRDGLIRQLSIHNNSAPPFFVILFDTVRKKKSNDRSLKIPTGEKCAIIFKRGF